VSEENENHKHVTISTNSPSNQKTVQNSQPSFSVKPDVKLDVMGKAANGLTFGQLGD